MKKYLVILIVGLVANTAMASKARLHALGQNRLDMTGVGYISEGTLLFKDNRNIFLNPAQVTTFHNEFSFEMGPPEGYAATPNAGTNGEGGLMYDFHGGKLGFQLGRRSEITQTMGAVMAAGGAILPPKDSVDIIYGEKGWGAGVHYASGEHHPTAAADQKSSEIILSGGMIKDKMEFYGQLGLNASSDGGTDKFNGRTYIKAGLAYQLDNISKVIGSAAQNGFDYTVGGAKTENNNLLLDVRYARTHKPKNDLMFFYGGGLTNVSGDRTSPATGKLTVSALQLPMFLGIEGAANSWMDLRASVTQAILLNTTKNPNALSGGDFQDDPNTTTIGAGATLKFTNFVMDATLAGATTGTVNANSLFAEAAIEYHF